MNTIAWLEFELAYFKAAVHHFDHDATGTPPRNVYTSKPKLELINYYKQEKQA